MQSTASSLPRFAEGGVNRRRLLAWAIDSLIITALSLVVVLFTAFLGLLIFGALWVAVGFVYRWLTIAGSGATPGMVLTGLWIAEADGHPASRDTALWHTVIYTVATLVPPLLLISVALMVLTPEKQSLSDALLGTRTLRV